MDRAVLKFCRFPPAQWRVFFNSWRSGLEAVTVSLDEQESEGEVVSDHDRHNAYAEWMIDNFPLPDLEIKWETPEVIEIVGEWFMNTGGDDISPETEEWNVWADYCPPESLPGILAALTDDYAKLIAKHKEDTSGFSQNAPALIRVFAEAMEAGEGVFYCHSCPA
jgi:hypothetical protein